MSQTRRLAAILAADVAVHSRLMGANKVDQNGTLEALKAIRREPSDPKGSLADASAIPARAAPCVIFAASATNRNRRRSTKSKLMDVFMRSSRLRLCLRHRSTARTRTGAPPFWNRRIRSIARR